MPYIAELLRPWQVQHEYGAPIYRGMRHAFAKIVAEDGLQSLWRYGFAAFVGRDLIYSGLRIGLLDSWVTCVVRRNPKQRRRRP